MATSSNLNDRFNVSRDDSCNCAVTGDTGTLISNSFVVVLATGTLVTNLAFILTVFFNRPLHTYTNKLLVSNAVTDLLVGLIVMPFHILKNIQDNCWPGSTELCNCVQALDLELTAVSIFHLTGVAAERYFRIVKVFWYERWVKRLIIPTIVLCWILPIPATFGGILGHVHQAGVFTRQTNWTFKVPGQPDRVLTEWRNPCGKQNPLDRACSCSFWASRIYTAGTTIFQFVLPILVMLYFYGHIFAVAYRQAKEMDDLRLSVARSSNLSVSDSGSIPEQSPGPMTPSSAALRRGSRPTLLFSKDIRMVRLCALVFLVFLICWSPYFIMMTLEAHCVGPNYRSDADIYAPSDAVKKVQDTLSMGFYATVWLGFLNSFLSPVLLFSLEKNYRNGFRLMMHRRCTFLAKVLKIANPRRPGRPSVRVRTGSSTTAESHMDDTSPSVAGNGRFFGRQMSMSDFSLSH